MTGDVIIHLRQKQTVTDGGDDRLDLFWSEFTHLRVVGHEEGRRPVLLHKVFGEESDPSVIAIKDDAFASVLGLPDEVILQQSRRVQIHHHINETWNTAGGQSLQTHKQSQNHHPLTKHTTHIHLLSFKYSKLRSQLSQTESIYINIHITMKP